MVTLNRTCAGCKWLDSQKGRRNTPKGYCTRVLRSTQRDMKHVTCFGDVGPQVRDESTPRCELYEAGAFETRYKNIRKETMSKP